MGTDGGADTYVKLMREVVEAIERSAAAIRALEESIARSDASNTAAHAALRDELRRAGESMAAIATLWKAEQAAETRTSKAREKAVWKFWESQPVQLLAIGLVLAFLQVVGVSWFAHSYGEAVKPPAATQALPGPVEP